MKRLPITLFVEEAPLDPFEPKGPQQYRVVASVPARETEVVLSSAAHDSVAEAVLDAFNDGVFAAIDRVAGDVDRGRHRLADHDRLLASLASSLKLTDRQMAHVRRALRALFTWTKKVDDSARRKELGSITDRAITDDGDWWWSPDPEMVRRASASPPVRPNGS